jgi:hypothetical protein
MLGTRSIGYAGPDGQPSLGHLKLSGLHLLAEKGTGFRAIFDDVFDRQSEF